jgi:hypothetical protein
MIKRKKHKKKDRIHYYSFFYSFFKKSIFLAFFLKFEKINNIWKTGGYYLYRLMVIIIII